MSITILNTITAPRDVPITESISLKTIRPVQANRTTTKGDEDEAISQVQDMSSPQVLRSTPVRRELGPTDFARVKRKENFQFAALCVPLFVAGYNDGSTGPLLPIMQRAYDLNFTIVSLIFVCSCIGYVTGAFSNVWFTDRFGFGKTITLGTVLQIIGYTMMIPKPPYPVFVIGYALTGFGIALQEAQSNGFVITMFNNQRKMSFLHASYGFGALSAPLVATQFAGFDKWTLYYCSSLGLSVFTFSVLALVFRFKTQEALLAINGHPPSENLAHASHHSTMRQIISLKAVHTMAFYLLVYVGVEFTLGGWIVTYIIDERGGGPNSGYISTGFFGGITLGRMLLHYVSRVIPEKYAVYIYAGLCLVLELTIWLVPSLIGNAISVSFIGFLLGPLYPVTMNQAVIPQRLLTGSIGWMAGFGQAGSALLPFITGALANRFGISSLQPFIIAGIVLMVVLWAVVGWQARGNKRLD